MTHAAAHWPRHFDLIASGLSSRAALPAHPAPATASHAHAPTLARMGAKAFHLWRMAELGLPVPPALVLGTHFTKEPDQCLLPLGAAGLPALEAATGMVLGDVRHPLVVSVRSGAPVSMPGMMETLLNIGLNEQTLPGLLRQTGNPRLVWDAYRRLIATYGEVVAGLPADVFEVELAHLTQGGDERELDFSELRTLSRRFLEVYELHAGCPFPQDVTQQLHGAVLAVYQSWWQPKARAYRQLNGIADSMGTAVIIQRMVFGNAGAHAGAGVGFTRDPISGERRLWADFLANAQGEDVVSGRRNAHGHQSLAWTAPQAWTDLQAAAHTLEQHFQDMQDFEFTVQDGTLYMLQTRAGKRTPLAATRIALDLLDEGVIDAHTALERLAHVREAELCSTQRVRGDAATGGDVTPLARATVACDGVVCGEVALDEARVSARQAQGVAVILVRQDAQTSDMAALEQAHGLLTQRGARTSHAAVVARQLGKVCLVGCQDMQIDLTQRTLAWGSVVLAEGEVITLDGSTGEVFAGAIQTLNVPDQVLVDRLRALRAAPAKKR